MSFTLPPPFYRSGDNFKTSLPVFESYCKSIAANEDVKKHVLLTCLDRDFLFDISDGASSLYELSSSAIVELALAANGEKSGVDKRDQLLERGQMVNESVREFVYCLQTLGELAYPADADKSVKNEVMYMVLLRGLSDRTLANAISKDAAIKARFY